MLSRTNNGMYRIVNNVDILIVQLNVYDVPMSSARTARKCFLASVNDRKNGIFREIIN